MAPSTALEATESDVHGGRPDDRWRATLASEPVAKARLQQATPTPPLA